MMQLNKNKHSPTVGSVTHHTSQRQKLSQAGDAWQKDLVSKITTLVNTPTNIPREPVFKFEMKSISVERKFNSLRNMVWIHQQQLTARKDPRQKLPAMVVSLRHSQIS
jgi:hypothetical protein